MTIPTLTELPPVRYTVDRLREDIVDLIVRNPDRTNPLRRTDEGRVLGCSYFKIVDGEERRCLIGSWLHERGHQVDAEQGAAWDDGYSGGGLPANAVLESLGYPNHVGWAASNLQNTADSGGDPLVWRELLTLTVEVV